MSKSSDLPPDTVVDTQPLQSSPQPFTPPTLPISTDTATTTMASKQRTSMPRPLVRRQPTNTNTTGPAFNDGTPLSRAPSNNSVHANNALRRMATHETGNFIEPDHDGMDVLDTHDEHDHEHDHDHDDDAAERLDEEAAIESPASSSLSTDQAATKATAKAGKYELQDQTNLLPMKQVAIIFVGLTTALFCSLLDQTIVTTALPTLGKVFNDSSISAWVGSAYLLTSTALQPVYGRVSDIFGRKTVLLGSLTVFLLGSLACSVAQTMIQLIIFRAFQGMGGGGILTLSMIIISDVVSLKDRGKFQGITGGVVAIANSFGPILGGIFTEKASWRWCFYINLPLTSCAIVVIWFLLPFKPVHGSALSKLKKLDIYGSVLTLAWAVLVLLALSWSGSPYSWSSAAVIAPLVIGVCLLGVFLFVEAKVVPLPLIPIYIFKDMTVAASMATTFCNGAAFYATLYYLPQYYQVVRGNSPIESGVNLLPLTFVQVFCAFVSGFLVSKTGDYKWNLMAGFFIWTIGLGLMATVTPTMNQGRIYGYQVLVGIGAGQTFQTSLIAIQASVARKDMATATGCRNFLRMLGGTIALAACSAIVQNIARTKLDASLSSDMVASILASPTELSELGLDEAQIALVREAYCAGIRACFYFMVPMAGISFFITVFFVRRISLKREDDAKLKAEGKAWVEAEKARKLQKGHKDKDHHGGSRDASQESVNAVEPGNSNTTEKHEGVLSRIEAEISETGHEMEEAAIGMEEAAGVQPAR